MVRYLERDYAETDWFVSHVFWFQTCMARVKRYMRALDSCRAEEIANKIEGLGRGISQTDEESEEKQRPPRSALLKQQALRDLMKVGLDRAI